MTLPVRIDVSTVSNTIEYAAKQALRNHLYENTFWMFYSILQQPESIIKMATAFVDRKRVGIAMLWDYNMLDDYRNGGYSEQIGCFINPNFRRQKIGTMLIERMGVSDDIPNGFGVAGSREFWGKVRPGAN